MLAQSVCFKQTGRCLQRRVAPALASLPNAQRPARYTRIDGIPETEVVRDYFSNGAVPPLVRVPKKIATPVRVEGKVWFVNERIPWLNIAVLGTLALALFNASKDSIARNMAYFYALVSAGVLIYGYVIYQMRITKIRKRDPGHFGECATILSTNRARADMLIGLIVVSVLFIAILTDFLLRVRELRDKSLPIPGTDLFYAFLATLSPKTIP
ncbi:Vacuole non-autophagic-related protein [Mycena sanguinolenta]|uniref:Vacuole non-autophagic-related protein n=1 Tax=Mycena sanguinolenta TaxID=230812 RepID=A0A8H7DHN3_9AGAR|nr:Vacuole non-autophagic-related protein [Mycena sanguinolenta]